MQLKDSKLQLWSKLNKKWERSGLAQAEFCRQENISFRTFGKWRQIIKSNLAQKTISKNNQKDIQRDQVKFLPVKINTASENVNLNLFQVVAKVKITQLEFPVFTGADYETLKHLFLALEV